MSVDILGTNCDQWMCMVHCCFTSTETIRLIRMGSPGRPPRLSHSSWTLDLCLCCSSLFIAFNWLVAVKHLQISDPFLLTLETNMSRSSVSTSKRAQDEWYWRNRHGLLPERPGRVRTCMRKCESTLTRTICTLTRANHNAHMRTQASMYES